MGPREGCGLAWLVLPWLEAQVLDPALPPLAMCPIVLPARGLERSPEALLFCCVALPTLGDKAQKQGTCQDMGEGCQEVPFGAIPLCMEGGLVGVEVPEGQRRQVGICLEVIHSCSTWAGPCAGETRAPQGGHFRSCVMPILVLFLRVCPGLHCLTLN